MGDKILAVVKAFEGFETIPVSAAPKLIAILERANNEALALLVRNRVKFCWLIARRILKDRGVKVEG